VTCSQNVTRPRRQLPISRFYKEPTPISPLLLRMVPTE
jgi:hypothetical protein